MELVSARDRELVRAEALAARREELWALMLELPSAVRADVLGIVESRGRGRRPWLYERLEAAFDRLVRLEASRDDARVTELLSRARRLRVRIDRARETLVLDNLHLVPQAVRRFRAGSIPMTDLIQEGHIGLLQAVDRFDPARGYRFSTYAMWWIRRAVLEAFAQRSRMIRLPESLRGELRRMRRTSEELEERLGRRPRAPEIAARMKVPLKKLRKLIDVAPEPSSIEDLPVGQDARLGGASATDPLERTLARELQSQAHVALGLLDPRERMVIRLRFGFEGGEDRTLAEIGTLIGVSRERVRQIERVALGKIQTQVAGRGLGAARAG